MPDQPVTFEPLSDLSLEKWSVCYDRKSTAEFFKLIIVDMRW